MILIEKNIYLPFPTEEEKIWLLHDFVSRIKSLDFNSLSEILEVKNGVQNKPEVSSTFYCTTKIVIKGWNIDNLIFHESVKRKYHRILSNFEGRSEIARATLAYYYTMGYYQDYRLDDCQHKKCAIRSGRLLKYEVYKATVMSSHFSISEMNFRLDEIKDFSIDADALSLWECLHFSKGYPPVFEIINKEFNTRIKKIRNQ